jgi:hypothetical protein
LSRWQNEQINFAPFGFAFHFVHHWQASRTCTDHQAEAFPGYFLSAGKRKSSHIPKGNVYLKTALVEAANAAARARGTYLRDKFYRLKARRGYKRAVVAVAHKILVAIYHMFSHRVCYNEWEMLTWTNGTNTNSRGTSFIAWNV